ncbi:MAG: valine--tRNA ligase [Dehalococcoidales bacterium]|nr:valine--tRNA ligase [Dehalococcoidales bacterium]
MSDAHLTEQEMPKAYDPKNVEDKWYKFWMEKDYFKPAVNPEKKPFTIIMPPPNVTGELHMGHALTAALEDIMIRWHRMEGDPALWLPGVDHASIAAQVVVERLLAKEGTDRYKLGREKFLERMWQWTDECRNRIGQQHRRLGASCDWSREKFTLDPGPSLAVRNTFVNLYNKNLIYRGERITNWCPRCGTALSDLEVDHKDLKGHLWHIKYPLADSDGYLIVATTRPETMLGDTAVAVNPEDERYTALVGKAVMLPIMNRRIPIVADVIVDKVFGTGAVKVTPAHDPADFEIAQRHKLELINILNKDATMNENAGQCKGMDRFACRKWVVEELQRQGLLIKIEDYSHAVGHCQRCATVIEPMASMQWFVHMEPLAKPAIEAVNSGRIKIMPDHFTRVYLNWMENIRDWCISRQLWWGHRIPAWYCKDCNETIVAIETPQACPKCRSTNLEQDPDVLDTWFSSGLWPHSTLGWPRDTEDMRYFYPTSVMETAYDILFFWVARMIMMGIENTGEIPFKYVYLHGLIRDEKGDKMSKTKGNVTDPLKVIEQIGADALRYAVIIGNAPGNDSKMSTVKLEAGRNFANKLWNATRFVIRSIPEGKVDFKIKKDALPAEDRWILSRLNRTIENVVKSMNNFQFGDALSTIYDFLWSEYCDWYIELAKIRLNSEDKNTVSPLPVLVYVLETSLRLLHPYMPFVTEELWQNLKNRLPAKWQKTDSIMIAKYPKVDKKAFDAETESLIEAIIDMTRAVRNIRAENKVEVNKWVAADIYAGKLAPVLIPYSSAIQTLAKIKPLDFKFTRLSGTMDEKFAVAVLKDSDVVVPMASMIDLAAEKEKLRKEIDQLTADITRLEVLLQSESFLNKAPAAVVAREKDRLTERKEHLARLKQQFGEK